MNLNVKSGWGRFGASVSNIRHGDILEILPRNGVIFPRKNGQG